MIANQVSLGEKEKLLKNRRAFHCTAIVLLAIFLCYLPVNIFMIIMMSFEDSIPINVKYVMFNSGRRGGLMVSELDSGSSGPGLSPGRGRCVVFLGKTLYTAPLSTQVYKWVPANLAGSSNIPSRLTL